MLKEPMEQLALWMGEAQQRLFWNACLIPGEPVIYRGWAVQGRTAIERSAGDVLSAEDIQRIAEAIFGPERLGRLGREQGVAEARVKLPDGTYAAVTAARTGGEVTLVVRPVRPFSQDWRALHVPEPIIQAAESSTGLLIVTGPPGSGKTTTAYGILEHLNATRHMHIVTVGYHLEYLIEPKQAIVQQRQIGVDVPDMLAGIQSALLQHADMIFVTEVRDLEVFQACLRAAEMECLVLMQLHLPTPGAALERMIALQPEDLRWTVKSALAQVLRGVLCQCLLPTPTGKRLAAYGVLLPDERVQEAILKDGLGLDELCNPRLEDDIQRLRDEGKAVPEAADEALVKLATVRPRSVS